MTQSTTLRDQLRDHIFSELLTLAEQERPGDSENLFEHGLDSLKVMRLLVYIEEELGVRLPDHEITAERLSTVDSLVEWIESHRS